MRAAAQEAVKRADRAAAEAEALRGELAAVQAAVEAGDPAAASAAQQQVRLPGACHVLAPQALTAEPLSLRRRGRAGGWVRDAHLLPAAAQRAMWSPRTGCVLLPGSLLYISSSMWLDAVDEASLCKPACVQSAMRQSLVRCSGGTHLTDASAVAPSCWCASA